MMALRTLVPVRTTLAGGDRRSIGRSGEVASHVLAGTMKPEALFEAMFDEEPTVRMRAADALEKVSARRPEWLQPFKDVLLARLPEIHQMEVCWHVAQIVSRLSLTRDERHTQAVPVLMGYLKAKSRIIQTFALQALADFAGSDPQLRPTVIRLVEEASRAGSPAVRSRSRRLLAKLGPS